MFYLEDAADILIKEDRVMEAARYLQECQRWAVKQGEVGLTDGGALIFYLALMENCKYNQINQVRYLLMEFFPRMHPKWFFKSALLKG